MWFLGRRAQVKVQKANPEKRLCGCSLCDRYTFARGVNTLRIEHLGYKGGMTEDHPGFSNIETTGAPNTCSLARIMETKPVGSRLKGELPTAHFSSEFCRQGHGLERKRWRRAASL